MLAFDKQTGLYYRENTTDLIIIRAMTNSYGSLDYKDQTVLDIGAHIGAFSRFAIENGAKKVIAIEPQKDNYAMLFKNKITDKMICLNHAVIEDDSKTKTLYVNRKPNKGMNSLIRVEDYDKEIVQCINFSELLERYKPTVIKIDIEGYEYNLFDHEKKLPEYIKQLAIEFHFIETNWRQSKADILIKYLIKENLFYPLNVFNTTTQTSKTTGLFNRQ